MDNSVENTAFDLLHMFLLEEYQPFPIDTPTY